MRTLLLISAIAVAMGELSDDESGSGFRADFESKPTGVPAVKVATYKGEPSIKCAATDLCDANADLANWNFLEDKQHYNGEWEIREHPWLKSKKQLVMKDEMKYYGLSRAVTPWRPTDNKPLAFSMTARFGEHHNCGGAYVKLYTRKDDNSHNLTGQTKYSIMFGPDRCGVNTRKLHFIIQYSDTVDERIEEHLSTTIELPTDLINTHQYSFVILPTDGGTVKLFMDSEIVQEGKLKELTKPGWKSKATIDDPTDKTPDGWKPLPKMIQDPKAVKPEDWDDDIPETIEDPINVAPPDDWLEDEPEFVPNPNAQKPDGWNDDEDGVWTRPVMKNPKCQGISGCGPWTRPLIKNPDFKGPWSPPMIPNPDYTEEYPTRQIPHPKPYDISDPFSKIEPFNSLGIEIWTVQSGTTLDNFMLTTDPLKMQSWSKEAFSQIKAIEDQNQKLINEMKTAKDIKETTESKRYVKIASAVLISGAILIIAVRKLFGFHFNASDSPITEAPATDDKAKDKAENKAPTSESASKAAGAKDKGKTKSDDAETETSIGETKPKHRAAD